MRSVRSVFVRIIDFFRSLVAGPRRDRAFDDEIDAHIHAHIEDSVRAGMTPDQARRHPWLALGGVQMTKDNDRDQRGLPAMDTSTREIQQAFGRLRRSPGFASAAILSLALAIGANVSIFTVVERVVVHPLPYPDSGRLVMLDFSMPSRNISAGFNSITARQYFFYADHARTLDGLAVYRTEDRTLTDRGTPERIRIARTTPSVASVLRSAPETGDWFPAGSVRDTAPVAVLSHGLWTRRYGADPGLVGRTVRSTASRRPSWA